MKSGTGNGVGRPFDSVNNSGSFSARSRPMGLRWTDSSRGGFSAWRIIKTVRRKDAFLFWASASGRGLSTRHTTTASMLVLTIRILLTACVLFLNGSAMTLPQYREKFGFQASDGIAERPAGPRLFE